MTLINEYVMLCFFTFILDNNAKHHQSDNHNVKSDAAPPPCAGGAGL